MTDESRIVQFSREIHAPAATLFELIADPARQPEWDGNNNLAEARPGQRVHGVGDVFAMSLTKEGQVRENHVVEFEEGARIAWLPAPEGGQPPGHLWRWELESRGGSTIVTHTYDWTNLHDEARIAKARVTTSANLAASVDRLAALAESTTGSAGETLAD